MPRSVQLASTTVRVLVCSRSLPFEGDSDSGQWAPGASISLFQSINQSINTFITCHGTEARATVRIMLKQREMS